MDLIKEMKKLGYAIYERPRFLRSPIYEVYRADSLVPSARDSDPYKAMCKALLTHTTVKE